jgi:hypothetical protein
LTSTSTTATFFHCNKRRHTHWIIEKILLPSLSSTHWPAPSASHRLIKVNSMCGLITCSWLSMGSLRNVLILSCFYLTSCSVLFSTGY